MKSALIKGSTRVIGESQGYLPLAVRDNFVNDAATGLITSQMVTEWTLSEGERAAIAKGGSIFLHILGTAHPPVLLMVGEASTDPVEAAERNLEAAGIPT